MTVPAIQTPPKWTRTRLIGFVAMGVCAIGYVGGGLALWAGKTDQIDMTHAAIVGAALLLIGEIGLWVGAACLGLTLFKKRKAMLNRLLGRRAAAASEV
ncbi:MULTISPECIES: hypothetical protein [unclassified Brevundimonas]|uniref:hypothetical protein n=1 Tax=unclassified Brevundimonas TaxID=2622653 RepID=UPI000E82451F|nr:MULTISPECIES: hypothetical protein [unclassified Brevundimonas]MCK6105747.1 hypothetical protein [Brevundimonas sp. EYE_349]HBI18925.1 hypothetical protein [Brevundimonas sp.]